MTTQKRKEVVESRAGRHGEDVYLVVVDSTEEFQLALRFVAGMARKSGAKIAILYVMDRQEFQHWGDVEKRMRWEQRNEGEQLLWSAAQKVFELTGLISALYLEEGGRLEIIQDVLKNDLNIRKLILGASTQSGNPGPLVSYFAGKGMASLPVPLTIVPGSLTPEEIDDLI